MPTRLKFIVAYDGAPFAGWQSQRNGNTVQDHLERAFASVTREPTRVHGAGRTDAGVHALAQCAHVELPERTLAPEQWVAALNTSLPAAIRVQRCQYVGARFHARFSAKGKTYRYRIWNDRILPPHEHGRVWLIANTLDVHLLAREAQSFVGYHDFASFTANRGTPNEDTFRTIIAVSLSRRGRCVAIEVTGDGFLYKMVRMMVGALVRVARKQDPVGAIKARLQHPGQTSSNARCVAPAGGLFLIRVRY